MTNDPLRVFEPGFSSDSADVKARELIDAWRDEWHLEPEPEMDGANSAIYESLVSRVAAALSTSTPSPSLAAREAAEDPHCWHCGVVLESTELKLRCDQCPADCDDETCSAFGCAPR